MRMTRMRIATLVTLFVTTTTVAAQDTEFMRALERAQQQRPAALTSSARIAAATEPGTPLVLAGRIVGVDGSPAANAIIFAYHTDRNGIYDAREKGPHSWRLKGWARSDAQGRFTFQTIRPGSYPNERIPAHVHFSAFTSSGERYHLGEVRFADDPLLSASDRAESEREGEFGDVRPVTKEGAAQQVAFTLRMKAANRF